MPNLYCMVIFTQNFWNGKILEVSGADYLFTGVSDGIWGEGEEFITEQNNIRDPCGDETVLYV